MNFKVLMLFLLITQAFALECQTHYYIEAETNSTLMKKCESIFLGSDSSLIKIRYSTYKGDNKELMSITCTDYGDLPFNRFELCVRNIVRLFIGRHAFTINDENCDISPSIHRKLLVIENLGQCLPSWQDTSVQHKFLRLRLRKRTKRSPTDFQIDSPIDGTYFGDIITSLTRDYSDTFDEINLFSFLSLSIPRYHHI